MKTGRKAAVMSKLHSHFPFLSPSRPPLHVCLISFPSIMHACQYCRIGWSCCVRFDMHKASSSTRRADRSTESARSDAVAEKEHVLALVFSLSSFLILNPKNPKLLQPNPTVQAAPKVAKLRRSGFGASRQRSTVQASSCDRRLELCLELLESAAA